MGILEPLEASNGYLHLPRFDRLGPGVVHRPVVISLER